VALALAPVLALGAAPDGRQIVLHGNDNGAMPCAACHGVDGQGNASIGAPQLAGMPAATIETGTGGNATMRYIAEALSPAETRAVADYFAGRPAAK
jgi:cytochrome c553